MNLSRKKLYLALSAVLTASAVASGPALAFSVDADANVIVTDDRGDALIFPFYSTNVEKQPAPLDRVTGARTSFSVTNTSPDRAIAVKIRFREQVTSQEVFDFIVFLSPEDKFDFRVRQNHDVDGNPTEAPRIYFDRARNPDGSLLIAKSETSCIAPLGLYNYDQGVNPTANRFRTPVYPIPGVNMSDPIEVRRALAVGHVEVIAMADITNAFVAGAAPGSPPVALGPAVTHQENGLPLDCAAARRAFSNFTNVQTIDGALDAPNTLIGRMLVTIPEAGVEAGTNAITIKNAFEEALLVPQSTESCITNPNSTCDSQFAWDQQAFNHPHFGTSENIENIEEQLTADALQNDWSRNEATNVSVDWVVSFPTKYVYSDYAECGDGVPGNRQWCFVGTVLNPTAWTGGQDPYPLHCQQTNMTVWDWDEFRNNMVSPARFPDLCNEVNVLHIRENNTSSPPSLIQYDPWRPEYVFENLLARERGWAELDFLWGTIPEVRQGVVNYQLSSMLKTDCKDCAPTPAVAGLAFTVRATGDPNVNNGSLTDLSRRNDATQNGEDVD
ncbi:MAG: hypothetical protein EA400_16145 [Chromatiaceae bacterium]|nr:MAG: hypothetical protein EA400_16145 [Chromatiaceae bacterium]